MGCTICTWSTRSPQFHSSGRGDTIWIFLSPEVHDRIKEESSYIFNSRVMVYDLEKWRRGSFSQSLQRWTQLMSGFEFEQLALNLEFQGAFDPIPWAWNVLALGYWPAPIPKRCIDHSHILHWNGPFKDWPIPWLAMRRNETHFVPRLEARCMDWATSFWEPYKK